MDMSVFINSLRDPMGLPFYPVVFQGLMVLTFALHIVMINLVVGSLLLALWGRFSGKGYPLRLAHALARGVTVILSVAIVLGVAPLLFVQTIYDPLWYSANLLSAWWAMVFLLLVTLAFLAAYVFYLRSAEQPRWGLKACLFSIAAVVGAGTIMHMLHMEGLQPQSWAGWFSGSGELATSGWAFHGFSIGRFGHFMAPALVNVGILLMLYAWYFARRPGSDRDYLEWTAILGAGIMRLALVVQMAFGFWWFFEIPGELNFLAHPAFHFGLLVALIAIGLLFWISYRPLERAPWAALTSIVTVLAMGVTREALRMVYLKPFDYSIYQYPVQLDWGSTLLFLATFVGGLVVMAYPLMIAFKSGRGEQV
ncbi:MAG: hypothetical protein C0624_10270 [Desulfuromonas sp.]|nr:MAG: hypothetical protein C0624_10270 [Desulfuromonas sp.]